LACFVGVFVQEGSCGEELQILPGQRGLHVDLVQLFMSVTPPKLGGGSACFVPRGMDVGCRS
jgi:hypothetical protein